MSSAVTIRQGRKRNLGKFSEKKIGGRKYLKKKIRGNNVRKIFGEDNVQNLFGEDDVQNLFREDNVRKWFREYNVQKCSGRTMS